MTAGDHDAVTIDRAAADAFWRRCISSGAVDTDQPVPGGIFWFGDRRLMADELAELASRCPMWVSWRSSTGAAGLAR